MDKILAAAGFSLPEAFGWIEADVVTIFAALFWILILVIGTSMVVVAVRRGHDVSDDVEAGESRSRSDSYQDEYEDARKSSGGGSRDGRGRISASKDEDAFWGTDSFGRRNFIRKSDD